MEKGGRRATREKQGKGGRKKLREQGEKQSVDVRRTARPVTERQAKDWLNREFPGMGTMEKRSGGELVLKPFAIWGTRPKPRTKENTTVVLYANGSYMINGGTMASKKEMDEMVKRWQGKLKEQEAGEHAGERKESGATPKKEDRKKWEKMNKSEIKAKMLEYISQTMQEDGFHEWWMETTEWSPEKREAILKISQEIVVEYGMAQEEGFQKHDGKTMWKNSVIKRVHVRIR
jgi:hypothetical protein